MRGKYAPSITAPFGDPFVPGSLLFDPGTRGPPLAFALLLGGGYGRYAICPPPCRAASSHNLVE